LVIVPTLNERDNLPELAAAILAQPVGAELLVVDDNSSDGTGAVADELAAREPRIHVHHRPARLGIGSAYVEGFQRALRDGFERVVTMDADWSHDPTYLPALVGPSEQFDLVVGSRYLHGISVVNWSLARLALSSAGNAYVRAITRLPLRDCTSGFQCIRAEALARIGLEHIHTNGYSFLVEVAPPGAPRLLHDGGADRLHPAPSWAHQDDAGADHAVVAERLEAAARPVPRLSGRGMLPADSQPGNARVLRRFALACALIVPLWWSALFVASMTPDAPRRIAIDLDGYFLPRYVHASERLAAHALPLWNADELAGVPLLGSGQGAVLYPPRVLLFGLLPPLPALHAFMVLHYRCSPSAASSGCARSLGGRCVPRRS
jgi:dolichol-phosphate mannosyltransferase